MFKKYKTRFSIRLKILSAFLLLGILSTAAIGIISYTSISKYEYQKLKNELLSVVNTASHSIDGDLHSQLKPGDEESSVYKEMLENLRHYKNSFNLTYLYTFILNNDETVKFVLDTDETDEQAVIGDDYENDEFMQMAFEGTANVLDEPYTDEWGTFLSAFSPVYNSKNEIIAIVGADISVEAIAEMQKSLLLIIVGGAVFSILLSILLALFLSSAFSKPIIRLVDALNDLARNSGDLTQKIKISTGDELELLAEATNKLLANIRSMVDAIRNVCLQVESDSNEITSAIANSSEAAQTITNAMENISSGALDQLHNINKSSGMLNGLSDIINSLSDNSGNINRFAKEAAVSANNCMKAVEDLKNKADFSKEILESATITAQQLEVDSEEIVKIIDTINTISEQTNLLALNASIEAARAGEHGRGFTIVANEIRKLAESTKSSTKEISHRVNAIKTQSKETSSAMKNIIDTVTDQSDSIDVAGRVLSNIDSVIANIVDSLMKVDFAVKKVYEDKQVVIVFNNEIQGSSEQMASATEEINASQQEQHSGLDNIREKLQNLNEMAEELKNVVDRFII